MSYEKLLMALPLAALFAAATLPEPALAGDGQTGMVVVRDPQTGQLRAPTPAERKQLTPAPSAAVGAQAPAAPVVVANPDGSRKVKLGAQGQVFEVIRRAPDGQLTQQCVTGQQAADRAITQPATAKPEEARHEDR